MTIKMLFMIALYAVANAQPEEECPAGMKKRESFCCKTVICSLNHYFKPCDNPNGEDKCMLCPGNTFTKYATDTSFYDQGNSSDICKNCTDFCLNNPEITLEDLNECKKTGNPNCVCNLNNGYCSLDPLNCLKWPGNPENIGKGEGLTQSCQVEKCKPGFYKDQKGYGECLKHRECSIEEKMIFNGNSTMDRQCGPLTQTTTPTKSTKMFDANSTVENSSTPTSPSNDGTTDPDQIIIGVVVGCILLTVVIIVLVVIYWHRRGRNNGNPGDEEQNRGLSPNGQGREPQLQNGQEGREHLTGGRGMVDTAC